MTGTLRASNQYLGSMIGIYLGDLGSSRLSIYNCEFNGKAYLNSVETTCEFVGYSDVEVGNVDVENIPIDPI